MRLHGKLLWTYFGRSMQNLLGVGTLLLKMDPEPPTLELCYLHAPIVNLEEIFKEIFIWAHKHANCTKLFMNKAHCLLKTCAKKFDSGSIRIAFMVTSFSVSPADPHSMMLLTLCLMETFSNDGLNLVCTKQRTLLSSKGGHYTTKSFLRFHILS